jgi:hypothetical protein
VELDTDTATVRFYKNGVLVKSLPHKADVWRPEKRNSWQSHTRSIFRSAVALKGEGEVDLTGFDWLPTKWATSLQNQPASLTTEYTYLGNNKCQAADGTEFDQWYKDTGFTESSCKGWCTSIGSDCVGYGMGTSNENFPYASLAGCMVYVKDGLPGGVYVQSSTPVNPGDGLPVSGVQCASSCTGTATIQDVGLGDNDQWKCHKKTLPGNAAASLRALYSNNMFKPSSWAKVGPLAMGIPRAHHSTP